MKLRTVGRASVEEEDKSWSRNEKMDQRRGEEAIKRSGRQESNEKKKDSFHEK